MPEDKPLTPDWALKILDSQRRTARAIADLALGLESGERQARERHQEQLGILIGILTREPGKSSVQIHEGIHGEDSAKFTLPGVMDIVIDRKSWDRWGVKILFWFLALGGLSGWGVHALHKLGLVK